MVGRNELIAIFTLENNKDYANRSSSGSMLTTAVAALLQRMESEPRPLKYKADSEAS